MKEVLLFAFNDFAGSGIARNIEQKLYPSGIKVKSIEPKDYSKPLGTLITKESAIDSPFGKTYVPGAFFADYTGPELSSRLITMSSLSRNEIDLVVAVCSECGLTRKDLKAVLTPVNAHWNAVSLERELIKEFRTMGG